MTLVSRQISIPPAALINTHTHSQGLNHGVLSEDGVMKLWEDLTPAEREAAHQAAVEGARRLKEKQLNDRAYAKLQAKTGTCSQIAHHSYIQISLSPQAKGKSRAFIVIDTDDEAADKKPAKTKTKGSKASNTAAHRKARDTTTKAELVGEWHHCAQPVVITKLTSLRPCPLRCQQLYQAERSHAGLLPSSRQDQPGLPSRGRYSTLAFCLASLPHSYTARWRHDLLPLPYHPRQSDLQKRRRQHGR